MKPHETFEEFAVHIDTELRRAYAGHMAPNDVAEAVNRAIGYAWTERRRMRRVANPIGFLYRMGQTLNDTSSRDWLPWIEDAAAPDVHPDLVAALEGLPKEQATAVWLVRACGWTNVQTGEALEISPTTVASRVAEGMARLEASVGQGGA